MRPRLLGLPLSLRIQPFPALPRWNYCLVPFPIVWPMQIDILRAMSFANLKLRGGLGLLDALTASLAIAPRTHCNIQHQAFPPCIWYQISSAIYPTDTLNVADR